MSANVKKNGIRWLVGACILPGLVVYAAPVEVSVASPSRLLALEHKAQESDRYRSQYYELQKTLDEMLALLPQDESAEAGRAASGVGQLSKLLEKASMADGLAREIKEARLELDQVVKQRDSLKDDVKALGSERDQMKQSLGQLQEQATEWEKKKAGLRETINRLLLGEFEYYEVKQGDSIQSIASNPLIYGDPSRAVWIRQANEGRVKHLDNLRQGEMLVVPRFPRNGSYEF